MGYGRSPESGDFLIPEAGDPRGVAEVLTRLAPDHGFDTFVLMGGPDPRMLCTFIEDVAPRVRERVAAARSRLEDLERHLDGMDDGDDRGEGADDVRNARTGR